MHVMHGKMYPVLCLIFTCNFFFKLDLAVKTTDFSLVMYAGLL